MTNEKETPLIVSCANGNLQIVNLLLSCNPAPNLNKQNKDGKTALEVAIDNYHSAIVMALVNKDAHLPPKRTACMDIQFLQKICRVGEAGLLKTYLSGEDEEEMEITARLLDVMIRAENIPLLELLLASDNVFIEQESLVSALRCACMTGSVYVVKMITEYDNGKFWESAQNNNESHLYVAISYEHARLVSFLIDCGCVPGKDSPLHEAFRSKDILNQLLKYDIPTTRLNSALMAVCRAGHRTAEVCARQLLDVSADVNYRDNGRPLSADCSNSSHSEIIHITGNTTPRKRSRSKHHG